MSKCFVPHVFMALPRFDIAMRHFIKAVGHTPSRVETNQFWIGVYEGYYGIEIDFGRYGFSKGLPFPRVVNPETRAVAYGWLKARYEQSIIRN